MLCEVLAASVDGVTVSVAARNAARVLAAAVVGVTVSEPDRNVPRVLAAVNNGVTVSDAVAVWGVPPTTGVFM